MPTSLRGVVKLYGLYPIISAERVIKFTTPESYVCPNYHSASCEKEHYTVCQLKYQKTFLALVTQLTDELMIFI